ncbi:MAG: SprB repeat-containing protein, partial [Flammeovirgaceae bacterium]
MKYTFLISLFLLATVDVFAQQCQNEDFEDGNTNGWTGYTGSISSIGVPVIKTFGFVAGRHTIMSGLGGDEIAAACNITIPKVESSGLYSLRLGNSLVGAQAERITKTFVVESGKEFFMYKYAVVLEDPSHEQFAQPRFEVRVFDKNGKLASCGVFKVRAGPNAANDGFQLCTSGFRKFWVKDWTVSGADLSAFVGEQVTIEFLTTDCAYGGHAGYAYVEASCKKLDIDLDGFCPTGSGFGNFKASVSEGFKSYKWSNGSSGNSTTFSGLAYGDVISVEVTTFTGCSSKFSRKLEPPLPVSINPLPDMQACKGEPFSLTATGTNVGFFVWDYNNTKASTLLITPANDVVLSYEAYDRNGCPTGIKDDVQLTVNGFDVAIQKTDVTCGQLQDGTISLTPQNGNAPFSYVWKDDPALNSNARVDLRPGKYEVKVSE